MARRQTLLLLALLAAIPALAACHNRATSADPDARAVAPGGPGVDTTDIGGTPTVHAEELLRGRFPGVRVVQTPGGGIAVRVWGPGTFMGDKDPLYVVDGMPVQVDSGRGLYWLNPGDIATIEVLKDISETASYGVRGANGVVVITTRRGDDGGG